MGKFSTGFLLGLGCSLLLAPLSGREMRQLLKERVQQWSSPSTDQRAVDQPRSPDSPAPLATHASPSAMPAAEKGASHVSGASQLTSVNSDLQEKLQAQGISNVDQLIKRITTKDERAELAQQLGLNEHSLKTLANRADFARLPGIGEDEARLLEEAGVNGSKDLQHRNPEHLYAKLLEVQNSHYIVSTVPSQDQVTDWIAEAMQAVQDSER